jgi:hypothetical protein
MAPLKTLVTAGPLRCGPSVSYFLISLQLAGGATQLRWLRKLNLLSELCVGVEMCFAVS